MVASASWCVLSRQGWGLWLTALLETCVQAWDVPPAVGLMWVKSNHVSAPHAGLRLWLRLFRRLISPTRQRPCCWQRWEPSRGWAPSLELPSSSTSVLGSGASPQRSFSCLPKALTSPHSLSFSHLSQYPSLTQCPACSWHLIYFG